MPIFAAMNFDLTDRQYAAVTMLFEGAGYDETAEKLGVSPRTLRHWRGLPGFRSHMNALREAAQEGTQDHFRRLAQLATNALEGLLNNEDAGTKLKAAQLILSQIPAFPEPSGASVGSCDPEDFKRTFQGVAVGNRHEEQCQTVLAMLEDFIAGKLTADDLEALLDVQITIEEAQELVADHEKLKELVVEIIDN